MSSSRLGEAEKDVVEDVGVLEGTDGSGLEDFVDLLATQGEGQGSSMIATIERELGLPEGAIVNGAPEKGLLPAREFIDRLRQKIDPA